MGVAGGEKRAARTCGVVAGGDVIVAGGGKAGEGVFSWSRESVVLKESEAWKWVYAASVSNGKGS